MKDPRSNPSRSAWTGSCAPLCAEAVNVWKLVFLWILVLGAWSFSGSALKLFAASNELTAATNRVDMTTDQRRGRFGGPERGVYKARINPHWFQNNTRFWYRNALRDGAREFIVVEAEKGARRPAFYDEKLAT